MKRNPRGKVIQTSMTRQSSRRSRTVEPAGYANDSDQEISKEDFGIEGSEEEENVDEDTENNIEIILRSLQERQAKVASAQAAAFQNQKSTLFLRAKKTGNELVRNGISRLEDARARVLELKNQEIPYEKCYKDSLPFGVAINNSVDSVLKIYPGAIEDLFPSRVAQIDSASRTVNSHVIERERSLKRFFKNANNQLEQSRENERVATDAATLIRHYKALLLA